MTEDRPRVPLQITIVFQCPNGFVTDLGAAIRIESDPAGAPLGDLPRYGVWTHDPSGGQAQVRYTTDDLEAAIAFLGC